MREIVIDTETTGLDPPSGDRVVEIGAVELINRSPTGQAHHRYVCPRRDMPGDAIAVQGLTAEFLVDKPLFGGVADERVAFVGDAPLVADNTLVLARRKHPGGHNTLGDLCARYRVNRSRRSKTWRTARRRAVGRSLPRAGPTRQSALQLEPLALAPSNIQAIVRVRPQPLPPRVTADDGNAHREFVQTLGSEAIWCGYVTIRSFTMRSTRVA